MSEIMNNLKKGFEGMTEDDSIDYQVTHWAAGVPLHNTVRDECCPDFSCCNGGHMMPSEARNAFLVAHLSGDHETSMSICMMGLSGLVNDLDANVHIAGEDVTEH